MTARVPLIFSQQDILVLPRFLQPCPDHDHQILIIGDGGLQLASGEPNDLIHRGAETLDEPLLGCALPCRRETTHPGEL